MRDTHSVLSGGVLVHIAADVEVKGVSIPSGATAFTLKGMGSSHWRIPPGSDIVNLNLGVKQGKAKHIHDRLIMIRNCTY